LFLPKKNLYYYIKQLRIGEFIFCHDIFLLYPFYPSIRQIISIFGWSNVCDRVHWSPFLSISFSSILLFSFMHMIYKLEYSISFYLCYDIKKLIWDLWYALWLATLFMFGKKLMVIIYARIIWWIYNFILDQCEFLLSYNI
jgi:hypothetical protein